MGKFRVLLVFAAALCGFAQSPLGTVTGLTTDASGAAVPNAQVSLESVDKGIKRSVSSNETGLYTFPNLTPGVYKITATAGGFSTVETTGFAVGAYRTVRQDLKFEVSKAATEITVTASASPVIQRESPAISTGLNSRQILELPTNLRSVFNNAGDSGLVFQIMPLTVPGVLQVGAGANFLVPGSQPNTVKLKVDGIETNFGNFGSPDPVSQPSLESVEEFTANLVSNRAEFGGVGTITTVTKSGNNDFHGGLFWFARNSAFDARNAFLPNKPFQNIHNFGGTLGGPIRKNRTFFYGTYDATHGSRAYLFTANVPTLAQREGEFTAALRNPYTGINPVEGNRILPQFISPEARRAQELLFPLPNFGAPALTAGNYRASFNGPETHRIYELRLDQFWTSGHSSFARFQHKKSDYDIPGARTQLPPSSVGTSSNVRRANMVTVGDTLTLRPNLINEFRAGLVILVSQSTADVNGQPLIDRIGIRGLPPRGALGVPNIGIDTYTAISQILLNPVNDGHWQLANHLSWIAGRHTVKFGGEVIDWFVNRYLPAENALFGNFRFTGAYSGNPYADFLLGLPFQVTRIDPYPTQYNRWKDFSLYAQDDYKVSQRLTLSYGLRYEFNQPVKANDGNLYSFDLGQGAIVVPGEQSKRLFSPYFPATFPVATANDIGLPESLRRADKNNFAPRFGFSWLLDDAGKTVLRGGWGVYYNHYSGALAATLAAGPYSVSTTSNNAFVNGSPVFTFRDPFAAPGVSGTLNLNAIAPDLRNAYVQQYNLSLERELFRDLGVRISYLGTKGTQLVYGRNVNQPPASTVAFNAARRPYPRFNNISFYENGAGNSYNALQTQVLKRFSRGLMFSSAWTWAKQLSDVDDGNGNADLNTLIEDAYDRRRDYGNVYAVPRHQWMNQVLYELPFGFQLNVLLNLQSGHFLNPAFSGTNPSNTGIAGGRPDVAGPLTYPETVNTWYDRAAFAAPPATSGRFGNAGRNIIEGPGYFLMNVGAAKSFRFERVGSIQIAASFTNVLNHTNLGQPNLIVNSADGGRITSTHIFPAAGNPRQGQLSLRWAF